MIFNQENAFENISCKILAIFRSQCFKVCVRRGTNKAEFLVNENIHRVLDAADEFRGSSYSDHVRTNIWVNYNTGYINNPLQTTKQVQFSVKNLFKCQHIENFFSVVILLKT